MEEKKPFPWRKKNVSKVGKIPLLSNTTKRRCLHISDLLKQLLNKLKKAQLFDIYLDETTDVSEEVRLILCRRFSIQETKNIGEFFVVLTLEFAQLLKPSSPNGISSLKIMDFLGWSIRQLLPAEQHPCNALLMELSEKEKQFPWLCFNLFFGGNLSVTDRSFLKWLKKLRSRWSSHFGDCSRCISSASCEKCGFNPVSKTFFIRGSTSLIEFVFFVLFRQEQKILAREGRLLACDQKRKSLIGWDFGIQECWEVIRKIC